MDRQLEELLRADPHIVLVEQAEEWDIPTIDMAGLVDSTYGERATQVIENLQRYLQLGYIIDTFQSHHERVNWRRYFIQQHKIEEGESYHEISTTALRQNRISGIVSAVEFLKQIYTGPETERFSALCTTYLQTAYDNSVVIERGERGLIKPCDLFEPMQKYAWAKQMKQQVYDILVLLGEQSAARKKYTAVSS